MLEFDEDSGLWFRPDTSDRFVLNEIFIADVYDLSRFNNLSCVIDLGGNIGAFSYRIASLFPNCVITALEPEPDNFSVLKENCFNIENINLINKAVWSHSDGVEIVPDYGGSSVWENSKSPDSIFVESIAFDELLEKFDHVDLMKTDIEGAEVEAFLSASPDSLMKIDNILGEFHRHDSRWGDWVRYLGGFFELNIIPHQYPHHMYGGMFFGVKREFI